MSNEITMDCGDMEVTITTRKKIAVASESPKVSNLPELNIPYTDTDSGRVDGSIQSDYRE